MREQAKFSVGQIVQHNLFDYRGVIYDVDPIFAGTDGWYESVARSRPPKDAPWYHVLVHESDGLTYVAERHLEADATGNPIDHPMLPAMFEDYRDGIYVLRRTLN
ncbi:MAG: heat shock protein HspQ [Hyphomicrobiaceae bacterium]